MTTQIFDVTVKVRVLADDKDKAFANAVKELALQQRDGDGHVPLAWVMGSAVDIREFDGDPNELPVLKME